MNQIIIKGNLGQNPELREVGEGQSVCRFSVAVNEVYYTKTKEKKETTTWLSVSVWGKFGALLAQRLEKGSRVMVTGKVRQTKYTDKQGIERTGFEVVASTVDVLQSFKSDGDESQAGSSSSEE